MEGIAWRFRTGSPWRELPDRFGPWQTAYERHSHWSADGTWAQLLAEAQTCADAAGELDWIVAADSPRWCGCTSTGRPRPGSAATPRPWSGRCGARCGSQGARSNHKDSGGEPVRGGTEAVIIEPEDHAIGRSRGGLTTKIHMISDGRGRPLVLGLTGGNINDTLMFAQLMDALSVARVGPGRPRSRPDYLLGDKGYSSRANRVLRRRHKISHTIPEPRGQQANRAPPRFPRRPSGRVRQGPLSAAQRRRARLRPAQTVAWAGQPLRQARPQLPRRPTARRETVNLHTTDAAWTLAITGRDGEDVVLRPWGDDEHLGNARQLGRVL
jgi:transposase